LCGTHFFYLVIPSRPQPRSAARNLLSPARRFNRVGPDTLVPRL
jgi:hypothetical protein